MHQTLLFALKGLASLHQFKVVALSSVHPFTTLAPKLWRLHPCNPWCPTSTHIVALAGGKGHYTCYPHQIARFPKITRSNDLQRPTGRSLILFHRFISLRRRTKMNKEKEISSWRGKIFGGQKKRKTEKEKEGLRLHSLCPLRMVSFRPVVFRCASIS